MIVLVLASGCRGLPPQALAPEPLPRDVAARAPERTRTTLASPAPVPVPALSPAEEPRPALAVESPAPTPLLDAALRRAESIEHEVAREVARPEPGTGPIREPEACQDAPRDDPLPDFTPAAAPEVVPIAKARPLDAELGPEATPAEAIETPKTSPETPTPEPVPTPIEGAASTAPDPLRINALRACRRVLSFGNIEPRDGEPCKPGRPVLLYCEVANPRYEPEGERFRSRLASTIEAIPDGGGEPSWSQTLGVAEDTCDRRRVDYFVSYQFTLPRSLPPGSYRLRLTIKDLADGGTAAESIPMVVRP